MTHKSYNNSIMSHTSTEQGNVIIEDDDLSGTRLLRDSDNGCCSTSEKIWVPKLLRLPSIKTLLFSNKTKSVWWPEGGRFVMHEIRSFNKNKSPLNRVRFSVNCMVADIYKKDEIVWTGHKGGEVYVWSDIGVKIQHLKISRSPIMTMCIVSPGVAWVGCESGNIKILELEMTQNSVNLNLKTTVVPGLAPVSRIVMSKQILPRFISAKTGSTNLTQSSSIANDIIPEEQSLTSITAEPLRVAGRSASIFASHVKDVVIKKFSNRAHTGPVRCIYARGRYVWTSGGKRNSAKIKLWNETDKSLIGKFLCEGRGPCSCMASIPWNETAPGYRERIEDWRLLTAHDSGKMLLWNPNVMDKAFILQPLLEIECRKSPIKSLIIFEAMGLMCTGHKDGTIEVGKLISPSMNIKALSSSKPIIDEDQICPFVPRKISESLHPNGLRAAVGGNDCLFSLSNSGRILYWPKDKLEADLKHLRQSSVSQMILTITNPSVMFATRDDIEFGKTIYEGDFATVRIGKFHSEDVVIKEANDKADSKRAMQALVKDARILSTLRHQNIVSIMAVGDNPPFIVMQYYEEGSLFDVLKKAQRNKKYAMKFNIERRLNVLIGVAKGMVFLHNQQETILHRDLKSPNVFIEKDFYRAAVGDFNLSKENYGENVHHTSSVRPSNPMWLAPEVARGETDFTILSDVYSFAIIMWEVLTGRSPWDHLKPANHNISRDTFYGKIRFDLYDGKRPEIRRDENGKLLDLPPGGFDQAEDYVKLIEECWDSDTTRRINNFGKIVNRLEEIRKIYNDNKSSNKQNRDPNRNSKDGEMLKQAVQTTTTGNDGSDHGIDRGQPSNTTTYQMSPNPDVNFKNKNNSNNINNFSNPEEQATSTTTAPLVDAPMQSPFEQCPSPFTTTTTTTVTTNTTTNVTTTNVMTDTNVLESNTQNKEILDTEVSTNAPNSCENTMSESMRNSISENQIGSTSIHTRETLPISPFGQYDFTYRDSEDQHCDNTNETIDNK